MKVRDFTDVLSIKKSDFILLAGRINEESLQIL